jgi:DNA-directed RNA polymerase alpha subunit
MKNPDSEYDSVTFSVDTNHSYYPEELPESDEIQAFLNKICDITIEMQIYCKELIF